MRCAAGALVIGRARARGGRSRGICEQISGITVWRWLSEDAIKPWQYRSWIFPRDPSFTVKAGRILDLYAGRWEGELLHPATTSSAATRNPRSKPALADTPRCPPSPTSNAGSTSSTNTNARRALLLRRLGQHAAPGCSTAARDKDGIIPFDKLVAQFMSVEPYSKARRVFVIVDNASAHRARRQSNASKADTRT